MEVPQVMAGNQQAVLPGSRRSCLSLLRVAPLVSAPLLEQVLMPAQVSMWLERQLMLRLTQEQK